MGCRVGLGMEGVVVAVGTRVVDTRVVTRRVVVRLRCSIVGGIRRPPRTRRCRMGFVLREAGVNHGWLNHDCIIAHPLYFCTNTTLYFMNSYILWKLENLFLNSSIPSITSHRCHRCPTPPSSSHTRPTHSLPPKPAQPPTKPSNNANNANTLC